MQRTTSKTDFAGCAAVLVAGSAAWCNAGYPAVWTTVVRLKVSNTTVKKEKSKTWKLYHVQVHARVRVHLEGQVRLEVYVYTAGCLILLIFLFWGSSFYSILFLCAACKVEVS